MDDVMTKSVAQNKQEYCLPSANARIVVKTSAELGIDLNIRTGHDEFTSLYHQGNKLGGGGFGNVYKGKRLEDMMDVVIKEIDSSKVPCWCALDGRLLPIEVILLHKCQKTAGVVSLFDVFELGTTWILVMEGMPGPVCDLFDYICECGSLAEGEAAYLMHQLVGILMGCHKSGLLHRDIKDENILINRQTHQIFLIDFGSGAFLHDSIYTDFDGTRVYCPPEWIIHGKYFGKPAEIWSLGVLLYDMLCGDVPFVNDKGIIAGRLKYRKDGLTDEARGLICSCMNRDIGQRPTLLEILHHPWMCMHRPAMSERLPGSIITAFEALINARPNHYLHLPPLEGTNQVERLPNRMSTLSGADTSTHPFSSNPSSTPSSNLRQKQFLTSLRKTSSFVFRQPIIGEVKRSAKTGSSFRESQENVQWSLLANSNLSSHPPADEIKDSISDSATHPNRSYASSGYYSRSNSVSSEGGKKKSGTVTMANMQKRQITDSQSAWSETFKPASLNNSTDWRKTAVNYSNSSISTSSTSSSFGESQNTTCTEPIYASKPAFHPPDEMHHRVPVVISQTSISCSNIPAQSSNKHNGLKINHSDTVNTHRLDQFGSPQFINKISSYMNDTDSEIQQGYTTKQHISSRISANLVNSSKIEIQRPSISIMRQS